MWPTRTALESAISATGTPGASTLSTATSIVGSRPATRAASARPSGPVILTPSSTGTVWSAVTTSPGRQCTPVDPSRARPATLKTARPARSTAAARSFERPCNPFIRSSIDKAIVHRQDARRRVEGESPEWVGRGSVAGAGDRDALEGREALGHRRVAAAADPHLAVDDDARDAGDVAA